MSGKLAYSSKLSWNTITSVPARKTGSPDDSAGPPVSAAVPLSPSLVAVMVAAPSATPCPRPVVETVTTAVLLLDHVTVRPVSTLPLASFGVAVSCSAWPTWTGAAVGGTSTVATGGPPDAGSWQEPVPASLNTPPPDRMNCQGYPSVTRGRLSTPETGGFR